MKILINCSPYSDMSGYKPRIINPDHIVSAERIGGELVINFPNAVRLICAGDDAERVWKWLCKGAADLTWEGEL